MSECQKTDNPNMVEFDEEFIAIAVPANTVELELSAKVWHDGKIVTVARTLPFEEVRKRLKKLKKDTFRQTRFSY